MKGTSALLLTLFLAAGCSDPNDSGARSDANDASETFSDAGQASPLDALEFEVTDALLGRVNALSPLPPPPVDRTNRVAADPAAAALGQRLFFDERFSANGAVSCATCHDPKTGFTDGRQLAFGISEGNRHTPTLWNVAYHRWLTWDGRADSLWMQALDPIEDPREMGTNRGRVALEIAADEGLRAAYEALFGEIPALALEWGDEGQRALGARPRLRIDGADEEAWPETVAHWEELPPDVRDAIDLVFVNVGKCLAAYQATLVRGDAPFDRFVEGLNEEDPEKLAALSPAAQRGLALFLGKGNCTLCHNGPNFSDGEFHNNSLPTLHGDEPIDPGRYAGTAVLKASPFNAAGPHSDDPGGPRGPEIQSLSESSTSWGEFRTPSLRNLADRAPFMHQGQMPDLASVLEFYSELEGASGRNHHQEQILVPLRLSDSEKVDLMAFLESLEGQALPVSRTRRPSAQYPSRSGTR
ncbi:Cytochrome c551 peroxidase precursor [Planctomycetes bacterium Poly30]|uniref:Cytochrome c551 peroxidase n=1 Tax=Saltatorellus ferox TaxID=2528018 RepID=A0A518EWX6_9BACT|nr:Cytochrome c551 peroxidase precursor [Planctomycetes bacterium Poly30]